jgi:2-amino-4-hydroxy-6-hydroxymethyldihydropteridine diphosphokinase
MSSLDFLDSFFIATGTNLGDRAQNLLAAKKILQKHFQMIAESQIYESSAVDYLNQPDFYNQVLEFKIPNIPPQKVMSLLLQIEKDLGRNRLIPKGPRLIDLDILFWGLEKIESKNLEIPHPRLFERSFVVLPLSELPGFKILKLHFDFKLHFGVMATALRD